MELIIKEKSALVLEIKINNQDEHERLIQTLMNSNNDIMIYRLQKQLEDARDVWNKT